MKTSRKIILGVAAATGLGLTVAAFSAPPGGWGDCHYGDGPGMMMGHMMGDGPGMRGGRGDPEQMQERMAQRQERMQERMTAHFDEVKSVLNLTEEQQPAWDSFVTTIQNQMGQMGPGMGGMMNQAQGSDPMALMDSRIQFMEQRLEGMKEVRGAMEQVYTSLSDEQKAALRGYMAGHHGMMGRMGHRGW